MKTLQIYIIRHGEKTEDGSKLSNRGEEQAKLLSKRLKKEKIDKIYSSDLQRCEETAEIISKELKLPIVYEKSLREVPSKVKEFPLKHKKEIRLIKDFWGKLNKEDGNILLVSSGIVNRILFSFALNIDSSKANFMQYPTGLTKIEKVIQKKLRSWFMQYHSEFVKTNKIKSGRFKIWYINETSHLPDKLIKRQSD